MLTLGLLTATAQPPMPRILDDGFRLMPTPNQVMVKPMKTADKTVKGLTTTTATTKRTKARADEPTYQVDFVLDFNTETQKAIEIRIFNEDCFLANYDLDIYQLENGSNSMPIPAGTYDIIVIFEELDTALPYEWPMYSLYVIREHVNINQDMTLNIAASDAKNHIHFQTLTIDGEPVYTGKYFVDEEWNWNLLEQGNIDDVYSHSVMACPEYHVTHTNSSNFGVAAEGSYHNDGNGAFADFYVSDVSDRYVFFCHRVALKGNDVYTSAYEVKGASSDVTVTNDPAQFTLFEDPFIVPKHQGEDLYRSFTMNTWKSDGTGHGTELTSTIPLGEGEIPKYYVSASTENSSIGYLPIIVPSISIKTMEMMPWGEEEQYKSVLTCSPLVKTNEQIIFANDGAMSFRSEYSEELDEIGRDIKVYPFWPKHPVFGHSVEKKKGNLGNNCPMLAANPVQYEITYNWEDEEGNPVSQTYRNLEFAYGYVGRYGETRPDDITDSQVSVKLNGEEIITVEGSFYAQMDELLNGEVDATITNETMPVDEMTGSNKAQLHYTAGAEDENPPTMTMLHFIANNGDVTDRFATADEATLEFTAGDFNFSITPKNYGVYDRQAPETVEVSYSPYGEDNWDELVVEEVPGNYWPAMGWFYTAPLASVTGEGLNGWFDLKIRLTDAAGNWQEQVLSPAFRIDDHAYSSVASVGSSNAHEVARYNLAGQRVDANATGVVIVKMSDGTARKVMMK